MATPRHRQDEDRVFPETEQTTVPGSRSGARINDKSLSAAFDENQVFARQQEYQSEHYPSYGHYNCMAPPTDQAAHFSEPSGYCADNEPRYIQPCATQIQIPARTMLSLNQFPSPTPPFLPSYQPSSAASPARPFYQPTASAPTPRCTEPNSGQSSWSSEQLEVLRIGKLKRYTARQIGRELKEKFGVERNPNVIAKRWAKMKKECVDKTRLRTATFKVVESIKQEIFGPGITSLDIPNGNANTQNYQNQMNESTGEILERLEGRVRNLINTTVQELESAGKPCSETEANVSAMPHGERAG